MQLYFDPKFIRDMNMYMDYRALFNETRLRSYGFKTFQVFITTYDMDDIIDSLQPQDIGRNYDNRVISWYLGHIPSHDLKVGEAIWKRSQDNNDIDHSLHYLLECTKTETIIKVLSKETGETLAPKMEELYENYLPRATVKLFFDADFVGFLNEIGFDFRELALKYIYTHPTFLDALEKC